jgi:hypothetical protein
MSGMLSLVILVSVFAAVTAAAAWLAVRLYRSGGRVR